MNPLDIYQNNVEMECIAPLDDYCSTEETYPDCKGCKYYQPKNKYYKLKNKREIPTLKKIKEG